MTKPQGEWREIEVGGHPCNWYEPPERNPHGYVVLYLHGVHLGNLRNHDAFGAQFDRFGLPVVGPVTQRSWWTDKVCPEFDAEVTAERHVLDRVMPHIAEALDARPPQIALLGTSMGGQGALRLAFKHPNTFPIAAAISPAIDYHLRWDEGDDTLATMYDDEEAARQDTAILHIHPLNWPRHTWFCCCPSDARWHASAERLHMKLAALGIPHEWELETEGGGHSFDFYTKMAPLAVEFIANRLDRERLRVV
jgi:S-formylglutathione hydrolase FrmB